MPVPTKTLRVTSQPFPQVGFGLWKVSTESTADVVYNAIKNGYRHFDGACDYGNEKQAGQGIQRAIKDGLVTRGELFITTKLWATFHAKEHVQIAAERQLLDFGLDYFDLYMIHFPLPLKYVDPAERYPPGWSISNETWETATAPIPLSETWKALEELVDRGLVKNLGVCNFQGSLLLELERSARIPPAVLQIEFHPYLVQDRLLESCKDLGIAVTAYSSFGPLSYRDLQSPKSLNTPPLFDNRVIVEISKQQNKTPAQILLRWAIQKGLVVIPKSQDETRQQQNLDIFSFELSETEVDQINSLNVDLRFNDPGDYLNPPQRIFA